MGDEVPKLNIYEKLVEVRKCVPYLQKENQGHQFKYVSSSQTLAAVREKMDEFGVLLVPTILDQCLHTKWSNKDAGASEHMTEIVVQFTWINAENPEEQIVCRWYGQGLDTGEKGVGKALTYAEKYLLLKFFNVATDKDDPDAFQGKQEQKCYDRQQPKAEPKKSAPKNPPPVLPEPEEVVDLATFKALMLTAGVRKPESMAKAIAAAGFDEGTTPDQLDVDALRIVYATTKGLVEQRAAKKEAA